MADSCRRKEAGAGIVLVLVLLAVSSLWVEHNLNAIRQEDRIAASFRQSQWALVAAEDAALRTSTWWSGTDASGQRHDQRFWGDSQTTRDLLSELLGRSHTRLYATLGDIEFSEDVVRFTVHGSVSPGGPVRTLLLLYRRPSPAPGDAGTNASEPTSDAHPTAAHSTPSIPSGLIAWFEPRDAGQPLP
jgi:hypothetical protein